MLNEHLRLQLTQGQAGAASCHLRDQPLCCPDGHKLGLNLLSDHCSHIRNEDMVQSCACMAALWVQMSNVA